MTTDIFDKATVSKLLINTNQTDDE